MAALLEVDGLSKRFGGLQAVNDVAFAIAEGGIVGLIGPNGAGKSTLFDLISGVQPSSSGRIVFHDRDVTGWKAHRIAALGMSRTFQKVRVFSRMTALENVMVGAFLHAPDPSQARAQAEESLRMVDLYEQRQRPTWSLTLVDRKRLEMARALSTRPSLLLLDEVLAGLNPQEITVALDLIRRLSSSGVTIMLVEHLLRVIMELCQRVLVMDYGQLIADGTPQEIRANPAVIKAYIGNREASRA